MKLVIGQPELAFNPFAGRIGQVFGEYEESKGAQAAAASPSSAAAAAGAALSVYKLVDESRNVTSFSCSFSQFVRIMHVFSPRATFTEKAQAAFKIYDFNHDDVIDKVDIQCMMVGAMGATALSYKELQQISEEVMKEADLDGDAKLEEAEFTRIVKRIPEFMSRFYFQVQLSV